MQATQNMRRVPAEWTGLTEWADGFLVDDTPDEAGTQSALLELNSLSNEQLEANRYYAYGQIICGVAQQLQLPDVRKNVVATSGERFAKHFLKLRTFIREELGESDQTDYPADAFTIKDLQSDHMDDGFSSVVQTAADNLSPEAHYTADLLTALSGFRSRRGTGRPIDMDDVKLPAILDGSRAAASIATNTFAGSVATIKAAYRLHYGFSETDNPVITPEQLRELDLTFVMAQLASLHIDLFNSNKGDDGSVGNITKQESGDIRALPDIMVANGKEQELASYSPTLHTKALACPALHIAGAIPLVASMVPDVLEAAQQAILIPEKQRTRFFRTGFFAKRKA